MEKLQIYLYDEDEIENIQTPTEGRLTDIFPEKRIWANVNLNAPNDFTEALFDRIKTHPLVKKGILDPTKRPRIQDFEEAIVFQINSYNKDETGDYELIKFVLGKNFLISFQEKEGDPFDGVRDKLWEKKGIIRDKGVDFLLFRLLESILEGYFDLMDEIQQNEIFPKGRHQDWTPDPEKMRQLEELNQFLFGIKKSIRPLLESVHFIQNGHSALIAKKNIKYFHDLKQQCQFLIDSIESFEHQLESSINMFFSMQGHRMNQVMKTLTVVSTIFIPLTFLAGIYGMNFEYMPELDNHYAYFVVWGIMGGIAIGMIWFLRMRKWF